MKTATFLFLFLCSVINSLFSQQKQVMGGCEYSISSLPNVFYCHLYGGPMDNVSCEQTINLCPGDSVKLSMTYSCVPDGTASGFHWKDHGINIYAATSDTYSITDTGVYSLTFYSSGSPGGGLITMGNIHAVCPTIGINEITVPSFKLFPNPAREKITVQSGHPGNSSLQIYNTLGEILVSIKLENDAQDIELSGLPDGVYLVRLLTDDRASWQKLIKNTQ